MKKLVVNRWVHLIFLIVMLAGALGVRAQDGTWVRSLRYMAFDSYNRWYPRESPDSVVIADIDETSLQDEHLGQWPWPRTDVARLVDRLKEMGATAIVFDMVFAEEDRTSPAVLMKKLPAPVLTPDLRQAMTAMPDHDDVLAQAFRTAGNVVTGFVWSSSYQATRHIPRQAQPLVKAKGLNDFGRELEKTPGTTASLPILEDAAAGNGSFGVSPDTDGIIRYVPLFFYISDAEREKRDGVYPSLALEGLRVSENPKIRHKIRNLKPSELTAFAPPLLLKTGNFSLPLDVDGRFYVHFSRFDPGKYIPVWKILSGEVPEDKVKGKIVLIGTSAEGLKDIRSTPLNLYVPGVEIHRNIIEQIQQGRFLLRPKLMEGAELLFAGVTALALIFLAPFVNAILLAIFTLCLSAGVGLISLEAYLHYGLLIDPIYPSLTILAIFILASLLTYVRTEMERRAVKQAFGLYISPDYMKELAQNPESLRLGGEIREITVMFTDVRGFTGISERLPPDELIRLMNDFLTPMSDQVMKNKGTIDKYIGDAMMAFWNAPLKDPDHGTNACRAALKMKEALAPVNQKLAQQARESGTEPIVVRAGIGINSGPGAVGNMGSRQRFAYSVLGDTVNLAARLESQTKAYGVEILIGEGTAQEIKQKGFALLELDTLRVKGKGAPAKVYTLLAERRTEVFENLEREQGEMLAFYRAGDFTQALQKLEVCEAQGEEQLKEYYKMMRERMTALIQTPPQNWDGVWKAVEK